MKGDSKFVKYSDLSIPMNRLFHGSHYRLPKITPMKAWNDGEAYVYGTPHVQFALPYCGNRWNDMEINLSIYNGTYTITEMLPGMLTEKFDTSGYLHHLDGRDFVFFKPEEYRCTHEVIPVRIETIKNVLERMEKELKIYHYPDLPPFIRDRKEYIIGRSKLFNEDAGKYLERLE